MSDKEKGGSKAAPEVVLPHAERRLNPNTGAVEIKVPLKMRFCRCADLILASARETMACWHFRPAGIFMECRHRDYPSTVDSWKWVPEGEVEEFLNGPAKAEGGGE